MPDFPDGNSNVCIFIAYTCQNIQLKSLALKIEVKVIGYNIYSYAIRWRISTYIKVRTVIFALAVTV